MEFIFIIWPWFKHRKRTLTKLIGLLNVGFSHYALQSDDEMEDII